MLFIGCKGSFKDPGQVLGYFEWGQNPTLTEKIELREKSTTLCLPQIESFVFIRM